MDLHLRVSEHKAEALVWLNGARYRMIGVRDEEPDAPGRPTVDHVEPAHEAEQVPETEQVHEAEQVQAEQVHDVALVHEEVPR
jgi:hypothetical protein